MGLITYIAWADGSTDLLSTDASEAVDIGNRTANRMRDRGTTLSDFAHHAECILSLDRWGIGTTASDLDDAMRSIQQIQHRVEEQIELYDGAQVRVIEVDDDATPRQVAIAMGPATPARHEWTIRYDGSTGYWMSTQKSAPAAPADSAPEAEAEAAPADAAPEVEAEVEAAPAEDHEAGYNGWRNYATWNISLWLGNDEGAYRDMTREVRRRTRTIESTDAEEIAIEVLGEETPDGVRLAADDIDWAQIASMMQEVCE